MGVTITAPFGTAMPQTPNRDFGMLKTRSLTVKQAQAKVYKDEVDAGKMFDRMDNSKLIEITKGADLAQIRKFSRWYYDTNGMYARAVRYLSDIYRFDFMIYPNLKLDDELSETKQKSILKSFNEILEHFDASAIQLMARQWAIKVCLEGAYYGYICDDVNDKLVIQDLPADYCRSRFNHRGVPLVEFNMQYFEKITRDKDYRMKILALFPDEIQAAWPKYEAQQLQPEDKGDKPGWILLDTNRAFKFNFTDSDKPPFLSAIPALIELGEVQDLEKEKLLQQIQKILIQQFELDKNNQLPFTMPELQRLNQNAIDMVGDAVGVSVLSTVANVHLEDLAVDKTSNQSVASITSQREIAYDDFGISTNLFNTESNLSLDKSINIDEAFMKPLLLQFEQFFNRYIEWKFNNDNIKFRLKMLTTTIFNYIELSDKYKDLTKLGFSRFLPMIALGHTQKEVVSLAKLEQQAMQLDAYMLPPFSSNTMSSDTWLDVKAVQGGAQAAKPAQPNAAPAAGKQPAKAADKKAADAKGKTPAGKQPAKATDKKKNDAAKQAASVGEKKGGRPEKPDSKKSDKTIANKKSK